jgi:pimeloyl-ACP methyl ester carboxylesterase
MVEKCCEVKIIAEMPTLVPNLSGSHTIPVAGHSLQQGRPKGVSAAILRFFESI